jgi:hypothetical protein
VNENLDLNLTVTKNNRSPNVLGRPLPKLPEESPRTLIASILAESTEDESKHDFSFISPEKLEHELFKRQTLDLTDSISQYKLAKLNFDKKSRCGFALSFNDMPHAPEGLESYTPISWQCDLAKNPVKFELIIKAMNLGKLQALSPILEFSAIAAASEFDQHKMEGGFFEEMLAERLSDRFGSQFITHPSCPDYQIVRENVKKMSDVRLRIVPGTSEYFIHDQLKERLLPSMLINSHNYTFSLRIIKDTIERSSLRVFHFQCQLKLRRKSSQQQQQMRKKD